MKTVSHSDLSSNLTRKPEAKKEQKSVKKKIYKITEEEKAFQTAGLKASMCMELSGIPYVQDPEILIHW